MVQYVLTHVNTRMVAIAFVYFKFFVVISILPLALYAVFFAPMGLIHDELHPLRHSLLMVKCH